ncbi:hypothetical protein ABEB36_002490 [Hypothenemus hampei]|uniref:RNA polymerase II subunit A C-terminal domain phosphatase n=1 Tax=Hypothenemus hampei TaxID=57062 RepID=A0ABD1F5Y8_HYPHA
MAEDAVRVSQQQTKPVKIIKWKVREGTTVPVGRVILLYVFPDAEKVQQLKLKASQAGIIHTILAEEDRVVQPGEPLYTIKACSHPTIMNDMCAECGADLRKDDFPKSTASVPMIHAIPDLKVSEEQAQKLGQADSDRLIKDRKLVLLVDLDQTLIHTTNDNIPPNIKDVYHFQLYGPKSPWYHTRLRPGTHKFLNSVCELYELHICTFGTRHYAHMIAMFLDSDQKFFSNRILSRDECFDPTSKKANLKALFPCGDDMVCIIDDREDVWSHATNLIHVKPYHFFQHTGDINAPPGLDKQENDEKEGVDLTNIVKQSQKSNESSSSIDNGEPKAKESGEKNGSRDEKEGNGSHDQAVIKESITEENEKNCKIENDNQSITNNQKPSDETSENVVDCITNSNPSKENKETELKRESNTEDNVPHSENCLKNDSNNGVLKNTSNSPENKQNRQSNDGYIEIEDSDDYLIYLEDILKRIHAVYYELFDKMESGKIPDLKKVIPYVKGQVLKGCKLVFSGLVPTHYKLEDSKAYQVARSLGAEVQLEIDDETSHLVAVRPGTAKVNAGRRKKNLKIVTPDWLWCCAERWEQADERIFPLNAKGSKNRHPPPHCSSPEHVPTYPEHDTPALRKRTPSGRFMDTINPLMSFSRDDIANMDKEVEDILDDDTDDDTEEEGNVPIQADNEDDQNDTDVEDVNLKHMVQTEILDIYDKEDDDQRETTKDSNSEEENDVNDQHSSRKRRLEDDENSQDLPSRRFRRGEDVDELDVDPLQDPDDNDSDSFEAPDEEDDGEWNMMGAALEREFLSD